ncbi:MAG: AAA family ATPase [Clostridia bacterium]|nr:AAA family ATPase [Clostridia bacterium]
MKINKISISSFGKLSDFEMKPGGSLNIIYAPNESGKTTLLSFIKYILYGTKQKKQSGDLSFKEKYTPWNMPSMSGSCEVETSLGTYLIGRTDNDQGSKLDVFDVKNGEYKKEITNPGMFFTKISERAFNDSCFITNIHSINDAQSDGELVSFLAKAYDDKATYSKIQKELTERMLSLSSEKRKSSKASVINGEILKNAQKLSDLENKISKLEKYIEKTDISKKELSNLTSETEKLKTLLKNLERDELIEERKNLLDEKNKLSITLKDFETQNNYDVSSSLSREEKELLTDDFSRYKSYMSENKFKSLKFGIYFAFCMLVSLILALGSFYIKPILFILPIKAFALVYILKIYFKTKKEYKNLFLEYNQKLKMQKELMLKYGIKDSKDCPMFVLSQKNIEDKYYASKEQRNYLLRHAARLDEHIEKLNLKIDMLDSLIQKSDISISTDIKFFTKQDINDIINRNNEKISELSQIIARGYRLETELEDCKSELISIKNEIERLTKEKEVVLLKVSEIETALAILESAFSDAKSSFFPELSKKTEELYSYITASDNCTINSNDKFELFVSKSGFIRDARFLSKGTLDILYFSLRIAIIELMGKDGDSLPVFLDDIFANCDDERLSRLMEIIFKLSRKHQIFMCTCRSREGDYFKNNKDVNIFTMQKG